MVGTKTSFYIYPDVESEIKKRCNPGIYKSNVVNRDLERLYALYQKGLKEVGLSIPEALLIVDTLKGSTLDAKTARFLFASVEDGIKLDGQDARWDVDGPALVEKLRGLNDIQALAVVDAAERFSAITSQGDEEEMIKEIFEIRE